MLLIYVSVFMFTCGVPAAGSTLKLCGCVWLAVYVFLIEGLLICYCFPFILQSGEEDATVYRIT